MNITTYADWDGTFPALVSDMPNEAYHAHTGISNSGLTLVARSPAHYYHAPKHTGSRAMEIGTAFHTALLEPERYEAEYMVVDGVNDRRVSAYKEAAKAYGGDKTLTESEGASVAVMREAVRGNKAANEAMSQPGHAELSAFVTDPETGLLIKCRFDWLTDSGLIVDIKKTQDCRELEFSRSLHNYRYHVQAAMYSYVYELIFGRPCTAFKILAIEELPPCANVLYDIDPLALMYGARLFREAMTTYANAKLNDEWESYSGAGVVTLPEWVIRMMEEEALENE